MIPPFLPSNPETRPRPRDSQQKALRISGEALPFIYGVMRIIASTAAAFLRSFLTSAGKTDYPHSYTGSSRGRC